nr:Wound-responsive family protein [Ipomoea batatas]GMC53543.1 Wound-responsive family protein [Ipomoea batatas]
MSSGSRAWIVAASMGAVEALKDQGFARWNYALRMIQQHAKSNLRPYSQATRLSSPSSALVSGKIREDKLKQAEESLRTTITRNISPRIVDTEKGLPKSQIKAAIVDPKSFWHILTWERKAAMWNSSAMLWIHFQELNAKAGLTILKYYYSQQPE